MPSTEASQASYGRAMVTGIRVGRGVGVAAGPGVSASRGGAVGSGFGYATIRCKVMPG